MTAVLSHGHIVAGIYLVQGTSAPNMPASSGPFWSLSDCLATTLPGTEGLSWAAGDERTQAQYRKQLGLEEATYRSLVTWTDDHFNHGSIGWPDVFLCLDAAIECHARFLKTAMNIKLLMLAVPPAHYGQALAGQVGICGPGESGLFTQLAKKEAVSAAWKPRGYEVLGSESGGQFHSFACNGLAKDYQTELGIILNADGLIDTLTDANRAAAYTDRPDVGAEPVPWLPWLVLEHELQA